MGLFGPKIQPPRNFRFAFFSFAEAMFIESVCRKLRGASGVFPDNRPYPREPLHPSAIAVFDGEPRSRVLIESPRRIVAGLKAKNGFSRLENFYQKMPEGFRAIHKDDPMRIEFWSFDDADEASREIAGKLAQRIDTPVDWHGPEKLAQYLQDLGEALESGQSPEVGLDAVMVLLERLGRVRSS